MSMYRVTIEGRTYEVEVEELGTVEPCSKIEQDASNASVAKEIIKPKVAEGKAVPAPLSGTIISVKIRQGQRVNKGDVLLTLEALKLENEITAPSSGTVTEIVSEGETVETDQVIARIS